MKHSTLSSSPNSGNTNVGSSTGNKKITVNNKLLTKISNIISNTSSIGNVAEFQAYETKYLLFENRPENWTEFENTIYEYTERVRFEITERIEELLTNGNAR